MEDTQDKGLLKYFGNKSGEIKNSFEDRDLLKGPKLSRPSDKFEYDTTNAKIGFALVFNQIKIESFPKREGTELDNERITKALELYGFDVRQFPDYTKEEILKTLEYYSKQDHSKNDCFVVVVMSHGTAGEIYASDCLYKVEELWDPFLGNNCKSLINKPKLFFIQCCRGKDLDDGTQYLRDKVETDSVDNSKSLATRSQLGLENEEPISYHIPHTADLLVYYSTFKNHTAWREPKLGSFFIQSLSQILEESSQQVEAKELYFLLTKVSCKVAYEYESYDPENIENHAKKQMPCIVSTLTKMFLIKPKN